MWKDTGKYARPNCPRCETPLTYHGVRTYTSPKTYTIDMSCKYGHRWRIEEQTYEPKVSEEDAV